MRRVPEAPALNCAGGVVGTSDVRDGTVNADRLVYGVVQPSDILAVLDPVEDQAFNIDIPSGRPVIQRQTPESPYWGDDPVLGPAV